MADKPASGSGSPEPAGATPVTEKPAPAAAAAPAAPAAKPGDVPATEKTGEPASKDAPAPAAAKAPEKYTLSVPAGLESILDADDLKAIEAMARTKGLDNDTAQALVAEQGNAIAEQSAAFRTELEADATYGGEHLMETQRLGTLVLDRFAPAGDPLGDAIRRDLVKTGYGNKLSVVSLLARIGRTMAEDQHVGGGGGAVPSGAARATSSEALAAKLYDKT